MIRTGGGCFSITRICTVLVWLRSSSGVAAPVRRSPSPAPPRDQIKILQRIAGRMLERDVERLEVVPLVFDLRPLGRREAEPAHDVLQLFDRLRDRMQPADAERLAGQRRIELRAGLLRRSRRLQPLLAPRRTPLRSAAFTSLNRLPAAGLSALATAPSPFCTAFSRPFRAEELDPRRFERGGIAGAVEGARGVARGAHRVRRGIRRGPWQADRTGAVA